MMSQLPEHVADQEIEEMFQFADKDKDGRINWEEFLLMITPVNMVEAEKPRLMKAVVRTEEDTNSVVESNKNKKVTLDVKSVENIRPAELEGEDRALDHVEMLVRTEPGNSNNQHKLEDLEEVETQAEETVVDEVGTNTEGSYEAG